MTSSFKIHTYDSPGHVNTCALTSDQVVQELSLLLYNVLHIDFVLLITWKRRQQLNRIAKRPPLVFKVEVRFAAAASEQHDWVWCCGDELVIKKETSTPLEVQNSVLCRPRVRAHDCGVDDHQREFKMKEMKIVHSKLFNYLGCVLKLTSVWNLSRW